MAIRRRFNWTSQQRVDLPHIRSVESAVSNDFDEMSSSVFTGESQSYVIRGFDIVMTGSIGSAANGLQMLVGGAAVMHGSSDESGTFFLVPEGTSPETLNGTTNERVDGVFVPNAVNFVGLELSRAIDDATSGQMYLWAPASDSEIIKNIPLARTLDYKIVITTTSFADNVLPLARVSTDVAGNVTSITDQRPMFFRLGTAGTATPDPFHQYPWSDGREENDPTSSSSTVNPFEGGDKQLLNLKHWMDAMMTVVQELKGTTYWYSPNTAGSLVRLRQDLGNTVFTGRGNISHDGTNSGQINWSLDIFFRLIGSRISYKILANAATTDVTLTDDQVAYINLVRGEDIIPNLIFTNGSAVVSSVGSVSWTTDLQAGDWVKVSSADDSGYYEIQTVDSSSQVTLTENFGETSTGPSGTKAKYAFGVYETNAAPSTDRHVKIADREDVPSGENIFWFLFRSDAGGATPRVYVRFIGSELEKGEEREVSDNTSEDILTFIGSAGETDADPDYAAVSPTAGSLAGQQDYNTSSGESLTARLAKVTTMLADIWQSSQIIIDPGTITWDGSNITVTDAQLSIPGTTIGSSPVSINNLGSTALADGQCLYIDISRTSGSALTLSSATALTALTPQQQRMIVARRVGSDLLVA